MGPKCDNLILVICTLSENSGLIYPMILLSCFFFKGTKYSNDKRQDGKKEPESNEHVEGENKKKNVTLIHTKIKAYDDSQDFCPNLPLLIKGSSHHCTKRHFIPPDRGWKRKTPSV